MGLPRPCRLKHSPAAVGRVLMPCSFCGRWARRTDAELEAVHDALVQSIPPQEMAETLRHMLPALSPLERHGMLGAMRSQMPAGAFDGVLQLAHSVLDLHAWADLLRALDLRPSLPHGH